MIDVYVQQVLERLSATLSPEVQECVRREVPRLQDDGFTVAEAIRYCRCLEEIAGDTLSEEKALARMKEIRNGVLARKKSLSCASTINHDTGQ